MDTVETRTGDASTDSEDDDHSGIAADAAVAGADPDFDTPAEAVVDPLVSDDGSGGGVASVEADDPADDSGEGEASSNRAR
ncbi:hypothetical protein NGTWS0302_09430 [Mycolicibacterium cyprinidarum]|uniref:Uncharacterized protein n=1 Tax=Mycolicibacterium cyprinidarum TaxID=2860311 RepID=A0ABQ4V5H0_9MYCO|nr:hypothetical protein NGTWS1702_02780 [Mycolicibacterium sp. NGTWSNA01]GJF15520.1 hypothetical protein NGTWS0302_09430 [Mycolicibacterium sp. NGTWS0302]